VFGDCGEELIDIGVDAEVEDLKPGTFYLTDYMVRLFDIIVWSGLGLDRHPELLPIYFGNYTRVVHLAHDDDPDLFAAAQEQATRLGLAYHRLDCGYGDLEQLIVDHVEIRTPSRTRSMAE